MFAVPRRSAAEADGAGACVLMPGDKGSTDITIAGSYAYCVGTGTVWDESAKGGWGECAAKTTPTPTPTTPTPTPTHSCGDCSHASDNYNDITQLGGDALCTFECARPFFAF